MTTWDIDQSKPVFGALDIARLTGAVVGNAFHAPLAEIWEVDAPERAGRFVMLQARMIPWLIRWRPVHVFIEKPMDARAMHTVGTPFHTQMQLTGLVAVAEMTCEKFGIPTTLYSRQDVLGHFTGVKRFKEKDDGKRACVVRCKQLGYYVEGYDQADAAALWDYGLAKLLPKTYRRVGNERALPRRSEDDQRGSRPSPRRGGKRSTRRTSLPRLL